MQYHIQESPNGSETHNSARASAHYRSVRWIGARLPFAAPMTNHRCKFGPLAGPGDVSVRPHQYGGRQPRVDVDRDRHVGAADINLVARHHGEPTVTHQLVSRVPEQSMSGIRRPVSGW